MGGCFSSKNTQELTNIAHRLIKCDNSTLYDWVTIRKNVWAKEDVALWDYPPTPLNPGNWNYIAHEQIQLKELTFDVFKKSTCKDKPRTAFCYWNGNPLHIGSEKENLDMITDFFMRRVELTANWTDIFTLGVNLLDKPDVTVWYMRYVPKVPIAKPRNLLGIFSLKHLAKQEYPAFLAKEDDKCKVTLLSMRNVPIEMVDRELLSGEAFITWEATMLLVDRQDGYGVCVYKSDAEDEDLWLSDGIGEKLTEWQFDNFVQIEARDTTSYIQTHRDTLEKDYHDRHLV